MANGQINLQGYGLAVQSFFVRSIVQKEQVVMAGIDQGAGWNVLRSQWLGVLTRGAKSKTISPLEAIRRAADLRCITAASPLDYFAAHRFLLTLFYWKTKAAGGVEAVRKSLLNGEVPADLITAIENEQDKFYLFDEQQPFLQDAGLATSNNKLSAGSLFPEMATGTNVAHFQHGDDKALRLCLSCASIGTFSVIPWSQSGGAGKSPSIHGAPPVMALASGKNLAVTLGLNFVKLEGDAGKSCWSGTFEPTVPTEDIPFLEAFTWNPRRVHLSIADDTATCSRCGQDAPVIGQIVYAKNERTKKPSEQALPDKVFHWNDPAAFHESFDESKPSGKANTRYKAKMSSDEKAAASEGDIQNLVRTKNKETNRPRVFDENSSHANWSLVVPCSNAANNKTYDHRLVQLSSLSPGAIEQHIKEIPKELDEYRKEKDGWDTPDTEQNSARTFVSAALKLFNHSDWLTLSNAANRGMHESPAAFDLFSSLYWGIRNKKQPPSRNTCWLMLKLMAAVPSELRRPKANAFCPLEALPKQQDMPSNLTDRNKGKGPAVLTHYPRSFPTGNELEVALRKQLVKNTRQRTPKAVDWIGLCSRLNKLID